MGDVMTGKARLDDKVAGKEAANGKDGRCPAAGAGSDRQRFNGDGAEKRPEKAVILPFPGVSPAMQGRAQIPSWPVLRRPRLLMTAARRGQQGYRRGRDLRRLMRSDTLPAPGRAMGWLLGYEAEMDQARRARLPEWDLQMHLLALIALLHEMRLAGQIAGSPSPLPAGSPGPGPAPGGRAGLVVPHPNPGRLPSPGAG